MANHGTAPHVTGSYVEFQAAVIKALPRDIRPDVALDWAQNGELLALVLREAIQPKSRPKDGFYPVIVDCKKSVEDLIKLGFYSYVDKNITSANFPTKRKGAYRTEIKFIPSRFISFTEELIGLAQMNYRPADIKEFLSFGEQHQMARLLGVSPIVALGSVWKNGDGYNCFPRLEIGTGSHWHLVLDQGRKYDTATNWLAVVQE